MRPQLFAISSTYFSYIRYWDRNQNALRQFPYLSIMITVALNGIHMHAHHGYFEEEAILGNEFEIDIAVSTYIQLNDQDDLKDTLDYSKLYQAIKEEMAERSDLLEHVLYRIKSNLVSNYPEHIKGLYLSIKKMNPPLAGQVTNSQIILEEDYTSSCAKCRQTHSCFNVSDCWCKSINLSDVTREQLARQYKGCLCIDCLTEMQ